MESHSACSYQGWKAACIQFHECGNSPQRNLGCKCCSTLIRPAVILSSVISLLSREQTFRQIITDSSSPPTHIAAALARVQEYAEGSGTGAPCHALHSCSCCRHVGRPHPAYLRSARGNRARRKSACHVIRHSAVTAQHEAPLQGCHLTAFKDDRWLRDSSSCQLDTQSWISVLLPNSRSLYTANALH